MESWIQYRSVSQPLKLRTSKNRTIANAHLHTCPTHPTRNNENPASPPFFTPTTVKIKPREAQQLGKTYRHAKLPARRQGLHPLARFGDVVEVDVQAGKRGLELGGDGHVGEVGFLEEGQDVDGGEVEELGAGSEEEDADC